MSPHPFHRPADCGGTRFLGTSFLGTSFALALVLAIAAAPQARAFSIVTPDGASQGSSPPAGGHSSGYAVTPQFDIEEQMRQFRTDNSAARSAGSSIHEFETPFGKGTMQFGVQRNDSVFGSMFGRPYGFGADGGFRAQQDRQYMNRMLAPPGLQHQYR